MDRERIEYLEKILRNHYGIIVSIENTTLISTKPLRTVFIIEAIIENKPARFVLHIRQKPYREKQEEEGVSVTHLKRTVPCLLQRHYAGKHRMEIVFFKLHVKEGSVIK